MLVKWWGCVVDGGSALSQHWRNVVCFSYWSAFLCRMFSITSIWAIWNVHFRALTPYKAWRPKGLFQFEIIINVLGPNWLQLNTYVIWLWLCGQKILSVRGLSLAVRFWRLKTVPVLKGLNNDLRVVQALMYNLLSDKQRRPPDHSQSWKQEWRLSSWSWWTLINLLTGKHPVEHAINPFHLFYLNSHPLEVVCCYREPYLIIVWHQTFVNLDV